MTTEIKPKQYDAGVKIAYVAIFSATFSIIFALSASVSLLMKAKAMRYDVEAQAEAFGLRSDVIYEKIIDMRTMYGLVDNGRSYRHADPFAAVMSKCNSKFLGNNT